MKGPGSVKAARTGGFSLLEVLVAVGIVTVGITAVLALFAAGVDVHKRAVDQTNAALAVQSLASELEARYTVAQVDAWVAQAGKKSKRKVRPSDFLKDVDERKPVEIPGFPGYRYSVEYTALDPEGNAVLARFKVFWRQGGALAVAEEMPVVLLKRPY